MKKYLLSIIASVAAVAASAIFYHFFVKWNVALYGLSIALYAIAAGCLTARFAQNRPVVRGIVAGAAFAAVFVGFTYLFNNVIFKETNPATAAAIVIAATAIFFIIYYCVISKGRQKKAWIAAIAFVVSAVLTFGSAFGDIQNWYYSVHYVRVATPIAGKTIIREPRAIVEDADFYVSPDGDDEGDGSISQPFATIERARDAVRALDKSDRNGITVAVKAGEYRTDSLTFGAEDGGTEQCPVTYCAYGDGEVVLNGGVTLPRESFTGVTDSEVLGRLPANVREKVLAVDLWSLGVTAEQYGKIYAIGSYNTAAKYANGKWVGDMYCELFIDDVRQTIARYPNGDEYLRTGRVISEGEGREGKNGVKSGFDDLTDPSPDVYKISRSLAGRIGSWATLTDVWMFGYWAFDWADASTPIGEVDYKNRTMSPMFVSRFTPKKNAPYYFFNVLEELDVPGEWYLDRDHGVMYFYPPEGFSETSCVELSLSTDNIIKCDADYLTFDGFTIKGTRGDAVSVTGNNVTIENCLIKNVAGNALLIDGYHNLVYANEITRTGKGGVIMRGGDITTLTAGESRAENNLVHDWSEIYETYQPAFTLCGVGNICAHNEIYNSPHEAITYEGNNHLIEYNLIHDVNLLTDDGGAIYSGRRWDWYGNVVRYNLIYDLGADGHRPVGIYMDDAIAGQTIYGNIIINAPNIGLQLGGGQDLTVHDNIVINSYNPITFDDRGLNGLSGDESNSFYRHYKQNGDVWQTLWASPWQSETWRQAYPQYERYSDDFSDTDNADFVLNPGHGQVTRNLLICERKTIGDISDAAYKYSVIEGNAVYKNKALKTLFVDPANGDYTLRGDAAIGFDIDVPAMSEFGRY